MLGNFFTISYHTAGTLAANHNFRFKLPIDAQLIFVSAVGSNTNNGILDVGTSSDGEAYVKNMDVGDGGTPALIDAEGEFEGDVFPHITAGTIIVASLDYDGSSGTAVNDFTLVLGFLEG